MALRNIVKEGDPTLRKISRSVINFDEKLWQLLDDMAETMYEADGCGLAAPQVGILRRLCVVDGNKTGCRYHISEADVYKFQEVKPLHTRIDTCYSMFCICSLIFSISDFISTTTRDISIS